MSDAYRDREGSCPRCRSALERVGVRGREHPGCARCRGLWLDDEMLLKAWVNAGGGPTLPAMTARLDRERRLHCVTCGGLMAKVMLEAVELDRCDGHGVWLDDGEILRVLTMATMENPAAGDDLLVEVITAELEAGCGDGTVAAAALRDLLARIERAVPPEEILAARARALLAAL